MPGTLLIKATPADVEIDIKHIDSKKERKTPADLRGSRRGKKSDAQRINRIKGA